MWVGTWQARLAADLFVYQHSPKDGESRSSFPTVFPLLYFLSKARDLMLSYAHEKVVIVDKDYQEILDSLPFQDKER